jgi:hypothetical protein
MFERADALLHEALAGGDPRRCDDAANFVLRRFPAGDRLSRSLDAGQELGRDRLRRWRRTC